MTKRNSGIDMLRILSMLGIVALHVIGLGGDRGNTRRNIVKCDC